MSEGHVDPSEYWPEIARRWSLVGPPLRPAVEDVRIYSDLIQRWGGSGILRALILGVTPELYGLPWPAGTDLLAADHTPGMIEAVWPGPREAVLCAEWTSLPIPDGSRDVVLCDAGLHLLDYPAGQTKLAAELRRVIAPGGICVIRLFVLPAESESPARVLADLLGGKIANVNVLKLRLAMSLQVDPTSGIELRRVWDALALAAPDLDALARKLTWPNEPLRAVQAYRDSNARYCFVSADQATALFCEGRGGFAPQDVVMPTYLLGELPVPVAAAAIRVVATPASRRSCEASADQSSTLRLDRDAGVAATNAAVAVLCDERFDNAMCWTGRKNLADVETGVTEKFSEF